MIITAIHPPHLNYFNLKSSLHISMKSERLSEGTTSRVGKMTKSMDSRLSNVVTTSTETERDNAAILRSTGMVPAWRTWTSLGAYRYKFQSLVSSCFPRCELTADNGNIIIAFLQFIVSEIYLYFAGSMLIYGFVCQRFTMLISKIKETR